MTAILKEDPPEFSRTRADIPPALDRIIRHCLEKNVAERFQSARDVAFALEALSGSATVSGCNAPSLPRAGAKRRVHVGPIVAAAARRRGSSGRRSPGARWRHAARRRCASR